MMERTNIFMVVDRGNGLIRLLSSLMLDGCRCRAEITMYTWMEYLEVRISSPQLKSVKVYEHCWN